MNKQWQEKFYAELGAKLKAECERQGRTTHAVSVASGQQFATVDRIFKGKAFFFHQAVWIMDVLGMSLDQTMLEMAKLTRAEAREISTTKLAKKKHDRKVNALVELEIIDLVGGNDANELI